jgi:hypothetical protein
VEAAKETRTLRAMTAGERAQIETRRGALVEAGVGTHALLRERGSRVLKPALIATIAACALHAVGFEALARLLLQVTAMVTMVSFAALAGMSLMLSRLAVKTVAALSEGFDRDLDSGRVAVDAHRAVRALAVPAGEDEQGGEARTSWVLELADGRVLFVHGSVPLLVGALPAEQVEVVRGVDTDVVLGVTAAGSALAVERTLEPFDYDTVLELAPVSVLPGPLAETLAELSSPVDPDANV